MNSTDRIIQDTWTTDNKNLIWDFTIHLGTDELVDQIITRIYWKNNPSDFFLLNIPTHGEPAMMDFTFKTGTWLKGYAKRLDIGPPNISGIFVDFEYTKEQQDTDDYRVEGVILEIPYGMDPLNPVGPVIPDRPSHENDHGISLPIITEEHDLFPYVFMRSWPKITSYDLATQFVQYQWPAGPPQQESLVTILLTIRNSDSTTIREDLDKATLTFINASPLYIATPEKISGGLGVFSLIWSKVAPLPEITSDILTEVSLKSLAMTLEELTAYLISDEYLQELDRVWQTYFALVAFPGYDQENVADLTQTLIIANALSAVISQNKYHEDQEAVFRLVHASILLLVQNEELGSESLFPFPPFAGSVPLSTIEGKVGPFAIGDLQMVKQKMTRYEPGDIAYIVNVMKGEKKEVIRRKLQRTTNGQESENNNIDESYDSSSLDEVGLLLSETEKVLDYTDLKVSYGPPPILSGKITEKWFSPTGGDPATEGNITRFAREVLNKSLKNVTRKITSRRSFFSLDESEETTSSLYENLGNSENLHGIYRWLNKVYEARVVNFGSRFVLEFLIQNPAETYINTVSKLEGENLQRPVPLEEREPPITSYNQVNRSNYASLAAEYGVGNIVPPPPSSRVSSAGLQSEGETQVIIPTGYKAKSGILTVVYSDDFKGTMNVIVGTNAFTFPSSDKTVSIESLNEEDGTVPVVVVLHPESGSETITIANPAITVEITCSLSTEAYDKWQIETYALIKAGYEAQLEAYRQLTITEHSPASSRPEQNRVIERKNIKRDCFKVLYGTFLEKVGLPKVEAQGTAGENSAEALAFSELEYLQFFEKVFDWHEMSWQYTISLTNDPPASLDDITQQAGPDQQFAEFLQADLAQVYVPVSTSDSLLALYYLSSGEIWKYPQQNQLDFCPVNPQNARIASELKRMIHIPEKDRWVSPPWEITIPTSMVILQEQLLNI